MSPLAIAFDLAWVKVTDEELAVYGYWLGWMVRGGKAANGNGAAPGAKPVMNCAARENTELKSKGVSNGFGNGDSFNWERM